MAGAMGRGSREGGGQKETSGAEEGRDPRAAPGSGSGGIRFRAVAIGLLMSAVIVGMTQAFSIERDAAEVGGGAPAPTPTYLLFFYALLAVPLAGRLHRR